MLVWTLSTVTYPYERYFQNLQDAETVFKANIKYEISVPSYIIVIGSAAYEELQEPDAGLAFVVSWIFRDSKCYSWTYIYQIGSYSALPMESWLLTAKYASMSAR